MSLDVQTLCYFTTDRNIINNQVVIEEFTHELFLGENELTTSNGKVYPYTQLYDCCYRQLSGTIYFLQLYTISGIITFQTNQNPKSFIDAIFAKKGL
ncbi:hypothetical protein J2T56_002173 [Natronobacillus azotifigens]|uniref:Uncharacterized protein n=1 Tax=Natronobacillus azotifigens TaxID=472978 RepID=A0A9J6REZ1_9BACI|nr:hypothetical protein [Natronobacillus azotifigens]MCZ0703940.1 hypothetical protein [Natronobacillus azotifigens]